MIQGNEVGRLDTAIVNKEDRAALLEAYKDNWSVASPSITCKRLYYASLGMAPRLDLRSCG